MIKKAAVGLLRFLGLDTKIKDSLNKSGYNVNFDLKAKNARIVKEGLPDGLPIPPAELIYLVAAQHDMEVFYKNGRDGADSIRGILKKNGRDISSFQAILDFGCGCGRIIRHWATLPHTKIYGTDYNPKLINWCRKFLTFAEFNVNKLSGKLAYADEQFDFIYSISVFTHLTEPLQHFWMNELTRILKPGGYMYITVHGKSRTGPLSQKDRDAFDQGKLVVVNQRFEGSNVCGTFHPESYIREKLCKNLQIIDYVAEGARDAKQDVVLLRKP